MGEDTRAVRQGHKLYTERFRSSALDSHFERQRAFASRAASLERVDLTDTTWRYDFHVVGEASHQDTLAALAGGRLEHGSPVTFYALVVPDPEDPFGKTACALMVVVPSLGPVAYFAHEQAIQYRAVSAMLLEQHKVGLCAAYLTGGRPDSPNIGVLLSIRTPDLIVEAAHSEGGPPPLAHRADSGVVTEEIVPVYARTTCPYCNVELSPVPKAKKKCPSCRQPIYVRNAYDGTIHLHREQDRTAFREAWEHDRAAAELAEAEAFGRREAEQRAVYRAKGALIDENGGMLEVQGESRFRAALHKIVGHVDPERWVSHACLAQLVIHGSAAHGNCCVRVEIDGVQVGFLRDDDAEYYEPMLRGLESRGQDPVFRATIFGKHGHYGVTLDEVPEPS